MSAVEAARSIDDLVLSPEGEAARREAMERIVDGIPVDLDPLPFDEPEPEPEPPSASVLAQRARHNKFMARAFPSAAGRLGPMRRAMRESGRWAPKYPDWYAEVFGGENEWDQRTYPLPYSEEPGVGDGEIVWGASVTVLPVSRLDPECAWEARDVPVVAPSDPAALDVAMWLETLYEPLSVRELVDVTGYSDARVRAALGGLHAAGLVARQEEGSRTLWVWRRLPQL